jgi:flagellar motor switch protein FliN
MSIEQDPRMMTPDPELRRHQEPDPDVEPPEPPEIRGLWSWLPRLSRRQVLLEKRLEVWTTDDRPRPWLDWLRSEMGPALELGKAEIVWRGSGLVRPGLIAQFRLPRLGTRLALGLEVPLAHAVVDCLLGYQRPLAESRLQLTPVEWGVWSYLVIRSLDHLRGDADITTAAEAPVVPASSELVLDRVGPDPFDPAGLGAIVTVRWSARVHSTTGTARLWLPESVINHLCDTQTWRSPEVAQQPPAQVGQLTSTWRAVAGSVSLPQGLKRLRKGGVLPLADSQLSGSPQNPSGSVLLLCDMIDSEQFQCFPAETLAASGGRLLRLSGPRELQPRPRHPLYLGINQIMNANASQPADQGGAPAPSPGVSPTDVPVTLSVELGRVSLTLSRLADLKPGDVIELGRHSREPVELTSGGRIVARGELVMIDTELGVRVTHVFL